MRHYSIHDLYGKSIKDKRGGTNNIHSWDIGLKGEISKQEKEVLNLILKERRKKKWAKEKNIDWMMKPDYFFPSPFTKGGTNP